MPLNFAPVTLQHACLRTCQDSPPRPHAALLFPKLPAPNRARVPVRCSVPKELKKEWLLVLLLRHKCELGDTRLGPAADVSPSLGFLGRQPACGVAVTVLSKVPGHAPLLSLLPLLLLLLGSLLLFVFPPLPTPSHPSFLGPSLCPPAPLCRCCGPSTRVPGSPFSAAEPALRLVVKLVHLALSKSPGARETSARQQAGSPGHSRAQFPAGRASSSLGSCGRARPGGVNVAAGAVVVVVAVLQPSGGVTHIPQNSPALRARLNHF